jgi:hypothetical protein
MSYVRRPLYTEERVRALFASTLEDLRAQHRQHLRDMADLRRELDQVRAQYDALCRSTGQGKGRK